MTELSRMTELPRTTQLPRTTRLLLMTKLPLTTGRPRTGVGLEISWDPSSNVVEPRPAEGRGWVSRGL